MRIGFDGKYLATEKFHAARSGHGVHARELLKHLMQLDDDNQYTVYLLEPAPWLPPKRNVATKLLPGVSVNRYLRNAVVFPLELVRHPVDVLCAFTAAPLFSRGKIVLHIADVFWFPHPEWLPPGLATAMRLATRLSVRRAHTVVATTEFTRREILRHVDVPADKVRVVPHGMREDFFERVEPGEIRRVRERFGLRDAYILSLNDIHARKGQAELVAAYERLRRRYDVRHQLVLAGRQIREYPELAGRLAASPYRDDIVLPGYVPSSDVRPLYQGASLFVYPSYYEGWGFQVHEAMASQVPVAVANRSTLPEIAGTAAVTFDPADPDAMADALAPTLLDATRRDALIAAGCQQARKFSWAESARQLLGIFRELDERG